jgi:hypothetical protein
MGSVVENTASKFYGALIPTYNLDSTEFYPPLLDFSLFACYFMLVTDDRE